MFRQGDLRLLLSVPGGRRPEPDGWNRFQLQVSDLEAAIRALREAGVRLRSDPIAGIGGNQVLMEDPSGNPVELFEPAGR